MTFKQTFICINCGCEVKELYKKYSNVVKTVNCEKCHKVVDKYVEFEPVIILLDTVLLSQQAYRHILYNRDFKNRLHCGGKNVSSQSLGKKPIPSTSRDFTYVASKT
ncbi:ACAT-related protein required for viability 1 isoform 3-T3 [Glossina fuscipes fuscipes]